MAQSSSPSRISSTPSSSSSKSQVASAMPSGAAAASTRATKLSPRPVVTSSAVPVAGTSRVKESHASTEIGAVVATTLMLWSTTRPPSASRRCTAMVCSPGANTVRGIEGASALIRSIAPAT